ncbi:MAG: methylated-DNA--[protein]-cysteine S-methyltransferase, partial [Gemmatimonadetes bacterium]|nr:methylated-DNA--[protein]-cysteine S-methyltransferase [Gemmatimonadota bacterium]
MAALVDADGALRALTFCRGRRRDAGARELASGEEVVWDGARAAAVVAQLEEYFRGERREFDLPLAPRGTAFQQRVWAELRKVPYGATISYGELAERLGLRGATAARAIGRANATNPIAIVVPCHRVIGADGALTGYAAGLDLKAKLLALEGVPLAPHGRAAAPRRGGRSARGRRSAPEQPDLFAAGGVVVGGG